MTYQHLGGQFPSDVSGKTHPKIEISTVAPISKSKNEVWPNPLPLLLMGHWTTLNMLPKQGHALFL